MAVVEEHFTEEHDVDSKEHEVELSRVSDEEQKRTDASLKQAMQDLVQSNKQLVSEIKNLVGKINVQVATEAIKPKVSEHIGVVTKNPSAGKADLDAREKKVETVLKKAESENKQNGSGTASEAKLGKTAAFCAILTAGGPFMLQIFQLFRDAMAGKDITGSLANAADAATIMALVKQWQSATDAQYWSDFASYFEAHTAVIDATAPAPEPTSADLVLILHYSSILNPVPLSANFTWNTAQEKADKVEELKKIYDPSSIAGKTNFIRSLASIKVRGMSVPRGVQANLGEIAVAGAIA